MACHWSTRGRASFADQQWHVPCAGDVVVVVPGKAACDMVLLDGEVVVDETILTGGWMAWWGRTK